MYYFAFIGIGYISLIGYIRILWQTFKNLSLYHLYIRVVWYHLHIHDWILLQVTADLSETTGLILGQLCSILTPEGYWLISRHGKVKKGNFHGLGASQKVRLEVLSKIFLWFWIWKKNLVSDSQTGNTSILRCKLTGSVFPDPPWLLKPCSNERKSSFT